MSTFRLLSALAFLMTAIQAYQLAQIIPQNQIQQRATYQGGWALGLPGADCPASAPVKCNADSSSINPTCCPEGQLCAGSIYPYCCPSGSDCRSTVQNLPLCANSTWTMYHLTDGQQFFCCEPGQFGVLPLRGYAGICVPNDQVVVSSLLATAASQVGGAAVSTVVNTAPASNTKTVTSSLKGGGITTITTGVEGTATATETATGGGSGGSGSSSGSISGSGSGVGTSTSSKTKTKKPLSTGAKIGIAIGGLAVLLLLAFLLFKVLQRRKAKRGSGAIGGAQAPEYTPQPQTQMPAGYTSTPVQEYKSPVQAGTTPYQGSPSPTPVQVYGAPAVQGNASGGGGYGQQPVEAPQGWERRVEM